MSAVAIALLSSSTVGALLAFAQFMINRHDGKKEIIQGITEKMDKMAVDMKDLREDLLRGRAISARIRILSAADEIRQKISHSREWWDQVMDDSSFYEDYCNQHPDFVNKKAVHAKDLLDKVYAERLYKNDFT